MRRRGKVADVSLGGIKYLPSAPAAADCGGPVFILNGLNLLHELGPLLDKGLKICRLGARASRMEGRSIAAGIAQVAGTAA